MTTIELTSALADRYRIERELGSGGMATVYLAHDVKHDRKVAVKILKPELGAVLGAERFLAEIKVTANLQHPNLLPLFDSGESGWAAVLRHAVHRGRDAARATRSRDAASRRRRRRLATLIAGALDYAHARGVIHRDLKPENILLQAGQPIVADFGIALAVAQAGGARITETGLSLGTPHYMSPEQATGDRVIDARSDQYALGAVDVRDADRRAAAHRRDIAGDHCAAHDGEAAQRARDAELCFGGDGAGDRAGAREVSSGPILELRGVREGIGRGARGGARR